MDATIEYAGTTGTNYFQPMGIKKPTWLQRFKNWWNLKKASVVLSEAHGCIAVKQEFVLGDPYCVRFENKGKKEAQCVLFGNNNYLMAKNHGNDSGVEVTNLLGSSYACVLQQTAHKPIEIGKIRVQSSWYGTKKIKNKTYWSPLQSVLTYRAIDANGSELHRPINLNVHMDPYQQQAGIIDVDLKRKPIGIDGNTDINFKLPPGGDLLFTIFPGQWEFRPSRDKQKSFDPFGSAPVVRSYAMSAD